MLENVKEFVEKCWQDFIKQNVEILLTRFFKQYVEILLTGFLNKMLKYCLKYQKQCVLTYSTYNKQWYI